MIALFYVSMIVSALSLLALIIGALYVDHIMIKFKDKWF